MEEPTQYTMRVIIEGEELEAVCNIEDIPFGRTLRKIHKAISILTDEEDCELLELKLVGHNIETKIVISKFIDDTFFVVLTIEELVHNTVLEWNLVARNESISTFMHIIEADAPRLTTSLYAPIRDRFALALWWMKRIFPTLPPFSASHVMQEIIDLQNSWVIY